LNVGQYGEGDGTLTSIDAAWGMNTDRSNLFIGASYVEQDAVYSRDREQSSFPVPGTGLTFGSSATPNGRFIFFPGAPSTVCPLTDLDDDPATAPVAFCSITTPNQQLRADTKLPE
jgi:iron complex outermembrane receptor protein